MFDYKVQLYNLRGHSMSVSKKVTLVNGIDKRFTAANEHSDKESAQKAHTTQKLPAIL